MDGEVVEAGVGGGDRKGYLGGWIDEAVYITTAWMIVSISEAFGEE